MLIDFRKNKMETLFKIIYVVHLLLAFNGFVNQTPITKITLFLTVSIGAVVGIQKLFQFKNLKSRSNFWILNMFIVSYIVSMLFNMKYGFIDGLQGLVWLSVEIWILYLVNDEIDLKKEFELVANVIIVCVTIANLASLGMFLTGFAVKNLVEDKMYVLGFIWGRLWGIYNDPNHGAIISSLVVLMSIYFCVLLKKHKKCYWFAFAVQVLYIYLSDSRTGILCLGIGLGIVGAMFYLKKFASYSQVKKACCAITIFIALVVGCSLVEKPIQKGMGSLANKTTLILNVFQSERGEIETDANEEIIVGREAESSDPSNRRFDIWKSGVEIFMSKPLVGVSWSNITRYAQENIPETYMVNNDLQNFASCHNMPIDVLVGQGLLGVVLMAVLIVKSFINIVKYINHVEEIDSVFAVVLFAILVVSAFASLLISSIFYINSPESFIFWLSFGYMMCLIHVKKRKGL